MDCLIQHSQPLWTGVVPHGLPPYHQRNYFPNFYFPRKTSFSSQFYPGTSLFFPNGDDVDYPTDVKGELGVAGPTMPYGCMADDNHDVKVCVVCGERASGFYFGALVCLPCKSFYIRCTKEGEPTFTCQCSGSCDVVKQGRIRCQYCRYQRCLLAGMCRKEKPETVQPAEGQVLCKVCGDIANGIHFGVNTCEGCKKFFRRGLVEHQSYVCKGEKECGINPRNRNNCRYCRYQKCLTVGMSREAIKMGRPKKADGSDLLPHSLSISPTSQSPDDDDTLSPQSMTNSPGQPSMSPRGQDQGPGEDIDQLKFPSVDSSIKSEEERPSCEYLNKQGATWRPNGNTSQWQQMMNGSVPNMTTQATSGLAASNTMTTQAQTGTVAATEFIEEEMDEILMLLQNDNQSQGQNWKPCSKKIHCYGYTEMEAEKCQGHCNLPAQNQPWNLSGMSPHNDMQPLNLNMNEPMNMTSAPMGVPGPPPQYPGYNKDCTQEPSGMTCDSPLGHRQSPTGYASDSAMSVNSPGYPANMSPVHSPSCQYSPQPSPQYQSSASPQHSDTSPQGSPYNTHVYMPQAFSRPPTQNINDLSVNIPSSNNGVEANCVQQLSSPHYPNNMTMSPNSSCPMTIPPQEGGGNSHGIWSGNAGHRYSSSTNPATIPTQERGYRQTSPSTTYENLQRINQYFSTPACYPESSLHLMENNDGILTRNDVEREVVNKTLSSVSPKESYYYVLSDSNNSDSNSSFDEFTSSQRQNKRKRCDDYPTTTAAGCQVGRYKRQLTENYWNNAASLVEHHTMTKDKQALLEHLRTIYTQMTDRCNENTTNNQGSHWEQVQHRMVRNTSAGVTFASQIPGFGSVHPEDKTLVCRTATLMTGIVMAGHQQYRPVETSVRDLCSWGGVHQNIAYPFKQSLLQIAAKIHATKMDMYEVSALSTLLFLSTDVLDLVYPEALEDCRRKVLAALHAYTLGKSPGDGKSRVSELFRLVPEIRHVGAWYAEATRQVKVTSQLHDVHQMVNTINM